ncbi:MAG: hypothetical protein HQL70_01590 [Magnetococcales bacterium]|nr:hypothetical protein [Magnetococcales bacterium]
MRDDKHMEPEQWLNFAEGYAACVEAAFHEGYEIEECPYENGSFEERCWKHGWEKAEGIIS